MKTDINVSISGLHSDNCIDVLRQRLEGLAGAHVSSIALGEVVLTLDESHTSKSELFAAIANSDSFEVSGYAVTA